MYVCRDGKTLTLTIPELEVASQKGNALEGGLLSY